MVMSPQTPQARVPGAESNPPRHRRSGAFTLIELLVVIGIIAMLVGILAPSLNAAREMARKVVCATNLHNWGIGMATYTAQAQGLLPWEGHADGDTRANTLGPWDNPSFWVNAVPPLVKGTSYFTLQQAELAGQGHVPRAGDKDNFVCPSAKEAAPGPGDTVKDGCFLMWGSKPGTPLTDASGNAAYLSPGLQEQRKVYWCYVWNSKLDNSTGKPIRIDNLPKASLVPNLVEKMMRPDETNPRYTDTLARGKTADSRYAARHTGGGQVLMFDGHVKYFTREYIITPGPTGQISKSGDIVWNPYGDY